MSDFKTRCQKVEQIKTNNDKLNACKRHKFEFNGRLKLGERLKCLNCGGYMDAVHVFSYCQGYEAAGCNPNDIIERFR